MLHLKRTDSADPDFQYLVGLLDEDLSIRDGNEHAFYAPFNTIQNIKNVIVCYHNGTPVACGAFKQYDATKVEIKRMFVLPEFRKQGIALAVLKELESWAAELNYPDCILETGKKQPEAISLYQKAGYKKIKNYGQYENVENSICMTKTIS